MRIAVLCTYILLSFTYLTFGCNTKEWGALNIITHIGFIGYLCYLLEQVRLFPYSERLFFTYLKYLSIINCIYIVWCVFRGDSWSIYHTDVFAYILGICSAIFFMHIGFTKNKHDD